MHLAHAQYPALPLTYLSTALLILGYPDQARDRCSQALAEARQAPPLTLALALDNALSLDVLRRDEHAVWQRAEMLRSLAEERANPFFLEVASFAQGWAMARRDQISEGLTLMRTALKALWAAGMQVQAPFQLAQVAESYGRMGATGEGLRCIDGALARAKKTGERWCDSELHRLRAHLLVAEHPGSAETCYRRAIEIARAQEAKLWELRAATSLAQLWRDQGKRAQAQNLLAPIYGWFTEGFDTADLKNAHALLTELG